MQKLLQMNDEFVSLPTDTLCSLLKMHLKMSYSSLMTQKSAEEEEESPRRLSSMPDHQMTTDFSQYIFASSKEVSTTPH